MDQKMIDRINELARKAKAEGLTEDEKLEQADLREAYRAAFRRNLAGILDHTTIVDEKGNVVRHVGDVAKPKS